MKSGWKLYVEIYVLCAPTSTIPRQKKFSISILWLFVDVERVVELNESPKEKFFFFFFSWSESHHWIFLALTFF
jgi:hypothetical protein